MKNTWPLMLQQAVALTLLCAMPPAMAETLTETVEQTLQTNPDVLIDVNRRLSADYRVQQAQGGYYPKVDLNLGYGREHSDNISTRPGETSLWRSEAGLTLTQMLYDGYATKSLVERSQSEVESAAYQLGDTSQRTALRTVEVYLEVLKRQELLNLIKENLAAHERTFDQIKLRSDSGVGRKADLEQIEARLALSQANVASAEANLREAGINFQRVAGHMPQALDKAAGVDCGLYPATLDDSVAIAVAANPAVHAAIANYDTALAQERQAHAALKPRVDLEAGASGNNNLDGVKFHNNDAYAMLRLKYNAYNGGADRARVGETQSLNQQALAEVERTKRQVEESTRLAWNSLQTAKDRVPRVKAHAEGTALTRDAYLKQFNVGQRTLLDLLDSENELFTAQSSYVTAVYDERFAGYRLMASMGRLLSTLGVAPREESRVAAPIAAEAAK